MEAQAGSQRKELESERGRRAKERGIGSKAPKESGKPRLKKGGFKRRRCASGA